MKKKIENIQRKSVSPPRDSKGAIVPKRILEILEDVGDRCRSAINAAQPAYKYRPDDWIFSEMAFKASQDRFCNWRFIQPCVT